MTGKRAHSRQSIAQFARDRIAEGEDPKQFISLVERGAVRTITYEEAAEMAFISDIIDIEMKRILSDESSKG